MKVLFIHQNFPGQYQHLARFLGADPKNAIIFLTQRIDAVQIPGVTKIIYKPHRSITPHQHHYLLDLEAGIINAQAVARASLKLKAAGFIPDVMIGHNGWGEIWYLKDIFPDTPILGYFEFFYRMRGADVGFDPGDKIDLDTAPRIRTKNLGNLMGLNTTDFAQCPTQWQKSLYPQCYHDKLHVVHEGINTQVVKPDAKATLTIPKSQLKLNKDDEVVTYVARNLEPYRGFPNFMRSLPLILEQRPNAHILIVGGDDTSYGHKLPDGKTHRQLMLNELAGSLDLKRLHFLGKVPYATYLKVLQVSRVHIYLTYPFVLSWSMLEAMAAGCLVVASNTAPVREVIQDQHNGLLVDFFSPADIANQAITVLAAGNGGYPDLRHNARQTIIDRYDLNQICLPAQVQLLARVRALAG